MVDVNTVVGEAVETKDGTVIVPVSRVTFGFVAGGGDELPAEQGQGYQSGQGSSTGQDEHMPFTGGSGAGVSVKPVGFLVVGDGKVRFLPVDSRAIYDRLVEAALISWIGWLISWNASIVAEQFPSGDSRRRNPIFEPRH